MADGEGWLFRPIIAKQMYKVESLYEDDSPLTLLHIAACNEALDVDLINTKILEDHIRANPR